MSTSKVIALESTATHSNYANIGKLPQKLSTVTAETLSRLLDGQALSQHDATNLMSCTRLSGIIYDLRHSYGWAINSVEESTLTKDGRTARYVRYFLPEAERCRLTNEQRADYAAAVFAARKMQRETALSQN